MPQISLLVQLVVLFNVIFGIIHELDEVTILGFETHIKVPHNEVIVCIRIRLILILRFLNIDALKSITHHVASLGSLVNTCDQMTVYKVESLLIKLKSQHKCAFVSNQVHDPERLVIGLAGENVNSEHVVSPYKNNQEHLPHLYSLHLTVLLTTQVLLQSLHLHLSRLPLALLSSPNYHVVLFMVRDHLCEVDILRISGHVESLHIDIKFWWCRER